MQHPAQTRRRPPRTYKREAAAACLAFLCGLAVYAASASDPAVIDARADLVGVLAFPVFLFAMGAFGLDAASKQLGIGKPQPDTGGQDYAHFPE